MYIEEALKYALREGKYIARIGEHGFNKVGIVYCEDISILSRNGTFKNSKELLFQRFKDDNVKLFIISGEDSRKNNWAIVNENGEIVSE